MSGSTTHGYNIGAVSRLTGIARERIRIWERRYQAVVPHRDAANNRRYSQADVDRLVLIRRLVDAGHAISQVARLSPAELATRLAATAAPHPAAGMPRRVLVLGQEAESLAVELRGWSLPAVTVVPDMRSATQWLAAESADLILAACPTFTNLDVPEFVQLRRAAPQIAMLLVYRFAPQRQLDQLARLGIRAVKAPLAAGDLDLPPVGGAVPGAAPPGALQDVTHGYRTRQFSAAELQRLGSRRGAVACECPHHLANLVRDLQAFEDYTLDCEAATPTDAALHREVYDVIARARSLTEDALGIIAAEEGMILRGR